MPHNVLPLGRLAVSFDHAGQGLGENVLSDALRRIASPSRIIGFGAVMVHAKDNAARRFYLRCAELIDYPQDSRTLFLSIETVVATFGQEAVGSPSRSHRRGTKGWCLLNKGLVAISGCSSGGKSTLLAELSARGRTIVEERGRRIIAEELASGGSALPWADPAAFLRRHTEMAMADHIAAEDHEGWIFFDRGMVPCRWARKARTAGLVRRLSGQTAVILCRSTANSDRTGTSSPRAT